jgi:hypothetical protein
VYQPANKLWDIECDDLKPDVVDEMLRQAELRQQAIFSASLGMDQRAAVIGAGLIAAAGALVAAGFAASGPGANVLMHAALGMALGISIGAAFCIWACRPQRSRFPGIEPIEWAFDSAYLQNDVKALKVARVAKLQDEMVENEGKQRANGKAISWGLRIALCTPAFSAIVTWIWGAVERVLFAVTSLAKMHLV